MAVIESNTIVVTSEIASAFPDTNNIKKILYPGAFDPLVDPTVIRPEDAYDIIES
jgi:hypothetical protein